MPFPREATARVSHTPARRCAGTASRRTDIATVRTAHGTTICNTGCVAPELPFLPPLEELLMQSDLLVTKHRLESKLKELTNPAEWRDAIAVRTSADPTDTTIQVVEREM